MSHYLCLSLSLSLFFKSNFIWTVIGWSSEALTLLIFCLFFDFWIWLYLMILIRWLVCVGVGVGQLVRYCLLECVWEARFALPRRTFTFHKFFFFFWSSSNFLTILVWKVFLCTVHGSHKIYFLATFSLKMGPTILFTHLKIILLQCFSVFSFSFQFSAVSKRTLSVMLLWFVIVKFSDWQLAHDPNN